MTVTSLGSRFLRFWHTVRYLRPVQVYGRVWFRLYRPRPRLAPAPGLRARLGVWLECAHRLSSMLGESRLRLLNENVDLESASDWQLPGRTALLRYNLHYFDDLNALAWDQRREWQRSFIARWIDQNPPAVGTGWDPYPSSLRIVNWIKWSLAGNPLGDVALHSLAIQVRHLRRRLEWHLLGNHLFANGKALIFAGCFFDGLEAERWLAAGLAIVEQQLPEQILDDGGQFERSPMYHALALEDLLDLINVGAVFTDCIEPESIQHWRAVATKMARWLQVMAHPDGEISFFNDAAIGVAPAPAELHAYAARLGIAEALPLASLEALQPSGYLRLQLGPTVLLIDVAPVGPDYLPGHAHADTLSFELSLYGQRVLVNSGIDRYGVDAERVRQRGSAAHNCVVVDGADSSEVWSGFRVAQRARPQGLVTTRNESEIVVECAHDGYRRLAGRVTHIRRWRLTADSLEIVDRVEGVFESAIAYFHVHPGVEVTIGSGACEGGVVMPSGSRVRWASGAASADLAASSYQPEFGRRIETSCLRVHFGDSGRVSTVFRWD